VGEQLHLDLVDLPRLVGGLDVDDAEFGLPSTRKRGW